MVLDDRRIGLERPEHAADAGTGRDAAAAADLAQLPIEAQVSTIVPSPTKAPMLTKLGISTTPLLPMRAAPGRWRARDGAELGLREARGVPAGELGRHLVPPHRTAGSARIASIGLELEGEQDRLLEPLVDVPARAPSSATRARRHRGRRIASSTASRTASGASPPSSSRRSQASSITCCSASVIRLPLRVFP